MTKYTRFEAIFRNETLVFTDRDPKFRNRLDLKRDLREWIKRDDGEPRNVIFFDGGGRIALEELPVNPEWCMEDVEAWFTENRYIHGVNSQYDCTGCLFTEWFKVFRRRGRWYAYHCIGMDI